MFVAIFCLWVVFNGRLTWEIAAIGAALSCAMTFFAHRFLGYRSRMALAALRRLPLIARYFATLAREIVRSNLALVRIVYSRREVKPRLVSFRTPLKRHATRAMLADSITLTPGTITVGCEDDRMTVHCLDAAFAEGVEDSAFQRLLSGAEGGDRP